MNVRFEFAILLLLLLVPASWGGQVAKLDTSQITVSDLKGTQHRLPAPDHKATVLFFIAHDCPISNAYAPEMNRIIQAYKARRVAFFFVYVDLDAPSSVLIRHAREFLLEGSALADDRHTLARWIGATVTPQAAVIAPDGRVLYLGRIDDLYHDFGRRRSAPTTHDLRDALEAILSGKVFAAAGEKPIGCPIPLHKRSE